MLKILVEKLKVETKWLNADEADVNKELTAANTSTALMQIIGSETKLVIIDEVSSRSKILIKNWKLLHDTKPDL